MLNKSPPLDFESEHWKPQSTVIQTEHVLKRLSMFVSQVKLLFLVRARIVEARQVRLCEGERETIVSSN